MNIIFNNLKHIDNDKHKLKNFVHKSKKIFYLHNYSKKKFFLGKNAPF